MNVRDEFQFEGGDQLRERTAGAGAFATSLGAPSKLVNRTHRVVRHRAKAMRARRSYVRSLMLPLMICSALLIVTVLAVWTGVYQESGAADAVQDISTSLASSDDEFMVMLFWFVPVTLAVLGTVWFTRFHNSPEGETGR